MSDDAFMVALQEEARKFTEAVSTDEGDWIVKGFVDVYKRIYAMPGDTKVISKVLELFLIPQLVAFGEINGYWAVLANKQNFYPDVSFISKSTSEMYAVDIKSSYRLDETKINGLTLGAFTGYFRDRDKAKNIMFPYSKYKAHLVLGVIYSQLETPKKRKGKKKSEIPLEELISIGSEEKKTYSIDQLAEIKSVIRNFTFFVQPKYRIASAVPGSGNTRNIGAIINIEQILTGSGPFSTLGEDIFDDYWMNYLNKDMSRKAEIPMPYNNITSYVAHRKRQREVSISIEDAEELDKIDTGPGKFEGEEE
jgi:hypothetical protein